MAQIIYTMKKLRKTTPQGKEILKGIWLSFYDGAKIGVLGHNGAGKSTLLRIMAGLDKDYDGEAFLSEGYTVGFLQQEPQLDPAKNVLQHVEDAVSGKKAVLARYEARGIAVVRSDRCGAWTWPAAARRPADADVAAPAVGLCTRDVARRYWHHRPQDDAVAAP